MCGACSTGIESTPKITEKDVTKAISQQPGDPATRPTTVDAQCLPFEKWTKGKKFVVTDDNIRRIFNPSTDFDSDTLHLAGKELSYDGYYTGSILDNREIINIQFSLGNHHFTYTTGKTASQMPDNFTVPFLVDCDFVKQLHDQLAGKEFFIRTPIWYDLKGQMTEGRKYIKVHINDVLPGSKIYPVKVTFTTLDTKETAQVWMVAGPYKMPNRTFDAMFSTDDTRKLYPTITDEIWKQITLGKLVAGMTRDEARLSIGAPATVDKKVTYNGLNELWQYNDGAYLIFEDGLLTRFRH